MTPCAITLALSFEPHQLFAFSSRGEVGGLIVGDYGDGFWGAQYRRRLKTNMASSPESGSKKLM